MRSEVYNMDCMEYMRTLPDKAFSLAVVDPPYGIGSSMFRMRNRYHGAGKLAGRIMHATADKFENWDVAPPQEYFDELFRVSRNQIIRGGNYFNLPPCRCVIAWDKVQPWENFSQVEIAWTSFDMPAKLFRFDNRRGDRKIHATQKPVELYAWIYKTFAKEGDTILDTHLGSGSSRIAAWFAGLDFVGCEIDRDYYDAAERRFQAKVHGVVERDGREIRQLQMFNE